MKNIFVIDGRYACAAEAWNLSGPSTSGDTGTFVSIAGSAVVGVKRRMAVQPIPRVLRGSSGAG